MKNSLKALPCPAGLPPKSLLPGAGWRGRPAGTGFLDEAPAQKAGQPSRAKPRRLRSWLLPLFGLAAASLVSSCQSPGSSSAQSPNKLTVDPTAPATSDAAAAAGRAALGAWKVGESGNGYARFLALLAPDFRVFSHPSLERGYHTGPAARPRLEALIATRLAHPDQLTFSNVAAVAGPPQPDGTRWVITLFDSAGATPDDPHFRGYNAIAFLLNQRSQVVGFREYFGDVKPSKPTP